MDWQALVTVAVVVLVTAGMVKAWGPPDILLVTAVVVLALCGIISPQDAVAGFANESVVTVGALFIVAAALRETGALHAVGARMLGRATTASSAAQRMAFWVSGLSAFLNNTPIVAMMLPVVTDWCSRHRVSPSRLLIPLSFFTVLGGMVTLIGTSTNLVVNGLMLQASQSGAGTRFAEGLRPFTLFEISPLGLACLAVGAAYLLLLGGRLLPDRKDLLEQLGESSREYLVDLLVQPECRLVGQSVESAGLRHLAGLFLIEIARNGQVIAPVTPDELLRAGDRLTFTGVVGSIVELENTPGLVPVADQAYEARAAQRRTRRLCEAVISSRSPLLGKTIRDADFRALYNAAVVAVHRGGERLAGRIGDIVLRAGDTLLLQTGTHFARAHRNDPDFFLVSSVEEARPLRYDRAPLSLGLLGLLIALMVTGVVSVMVAALLVAALVIWTRCIAPAAARESVDWQTLIGIAAAFALGKGLEKSGAAQAIAERVVAVAGPLGPVAVLAAVYLVTMVFTELITNNAAAALMFPFAIATANQMGVSPRPFAVAIMFAASLAFATPIGYQTNMMVYGPGGYRFGDFTRIGLPLNLLMWALAMLLIPVFWPFVPR